MCCIFMCVGTRFSWCFAKLYADLHGAFRLKFNIVLATNHQQQQQWSSGNVPFCYCFRGNFRAQYKQFPYETEFSSSLFSTGCNRFKVYDFNELHKNSGTYDFHGNCYISNPRAPYGVDSVQANSIHQKKDEMFGKENISNHLATSNNFIDLFQL